MFKSDGQLVKIRLGGLNLREVLWKAEELEMH